MNLKETEWYISIKNYKYKMIFGAKSEAHEVLSFLKNMGEDILCYIVSERKDNALELDNKSVKVFDEISRELKEKALIIISQRYENNENMEKVLLSAGFKHMISSPAQASWELTEISNQYRSSILGKMLIIDKEYWKDNYGTENIFAPICIYAVTSHKNLHKSKGNYQSAYIKYIQAGAEIADNIFCEITDNHGDNISKLNPYYCELTAGYWIYKNDNINEYVGLYHYSRGFDITDRQTEFLVKDEIDVLLPVPIVYRHELAAVLISFWTDEWIEIFLEGIKKTSPEYEKTVELFLTNKLFFYGNIVFAKKEVFCSYYEWMFKVFSECEMIRKAKGIAMIPRIWGYFGECLTNIYFLHHIDKYKIVYSQTKSMY